MQSPYLKQILPSWTTQNRVIPQYWNNLATAILELGPQLQLQSWWKEEAQAIEQGNQSRSTDMLPGFAR